ncbi:radical SAM protein [Sporomusa sp.]|uniref:radical SAM/SPASM domain-containing protein n=1 Tax=Sporomusa sp. TaxID=2078658 RepID=UPI002BCC976D|nr:radical SAM protein [Sporomusa sp.]HWR05457.1 radical SAM protein [Sporomusa sp.]
MKDYNKIIRAQEQKYIADLTKNITTMQQQGNYPYSFAMPLTIQYELTAMCNLVCKHCYNRSGDSDKVDAMRASDWLALSKDIVDNGGVFQCILSGGEPLLMGEKLLDIMDVLHHDGTSFVLITNGFLLTKDWVNKLKKYRFYWLQVSIDGANVAIHDEFRGVATSWERAVQGAFAVSQAGLPLVIAHTVIPESLDSLPEMVNMAYELGAASIMVGEVLPSGRASQHEEIILNPEQRIVMHQQIEQLVNQYRGRIDIQRSSSVKSQLNRYRTGPNAGAIIRPNGDVRMDCMAPFTIGNVLQQSLMDIWRQKGADCWNSDALRQYIDSIDEEKNCAPEFINHVDRDIAL